MCRFKFPYLHWVLQHPNHDVPAHDVSPIQLAALGLSHITQQLYTLNPEGLVNEVAVLGMLSQIIVGGVELGTVELHGDAA